MLTGFLVIEADRPGLMGDVEVQLFAGKAMATLPLADSPAKELVFPYVPGGPGFFAGLGLVNTTNLEANVVIESVNSDGDLLHQKSIVLAPNARVSRMLHEYASEFGNRNAAYIRVFSDQALVGIELFFRDDLEVISAVEAQ
jgi:hypothetical protein